MFYLPKFLKPIFDDFLNLLLLLFCCNYLLEKHFSIFYFILCNNAAFYYLFIRVKFNLNFSFSAIYFRFFILNFYLSSLLDYLLFKLN